MDSYVDELRTVLAKMERQRDQLDRDMAALRAMIARHDSAETRRGRKGSTQVAILAAMSERRDYSPGEIADAIGVSSNAVSAAMGRMARQGILYSAGRGQYRKQVPLEPDPVAAFTGAAASDDDISF